MVYVNYEVFGVNEAKARMDRLIARAEDFRPVFGLLQQEFYNIEDDLFSNEGSTGAHGSWSGLKDSTLKRKTGSGGILVDTEALRKSLTRPNQKGSRRVITRHSMTIGTLDPKADLHQKGTKTMKQRRVVDLTVSQSEYFTLQLERYLLGEIL